MLPRLLLVHIRILPQRATNFSCLQLIDENVAAETTTLATYHSSNHDAEPINDAEVEKSVYSALVRYLGQTEVFLKSVASKHRYYKEPDRGYLAGNLTELRSVFDVSSLALICDGVR